MSQQLVKKGANGRMVNVNPKSWIEAIKDKNTGQTLVEILQGFNMYFLPYNGNTSSTRCLVSTMLRKKGLWITYVKYDGNVYTEWYAADEIDDTSWGDSSNWRVGNNTLVGDISISSDGYWVINGEVTTIKAQGEAGITPILRVGSNNHLQVSYSNGSSYIDISPNPVYTQFRVLNNKLQQSTDLGNTYTYISEELAYKFQESGNKLQMSKDLGNTWEDVSDYIAAWFRFTGATGSSQADNVGKIQISRDNGATWSDLSGEFTNSLHIKGYVATVDALPSTAVQGDIYGVGPTYDSSDTEQTNPIYQLYVKDSTGWINNGRFTSISAGVVQELGDSETKVLSQKVVSEHINCSEMFIRFNDYQNINIEEFPVDKLITGEIVISFKEKTYMFIVRSNGTYIEYQFLEEKGLSFTLKHNECLFYNIKENQLEISLYTNTKNKILLASSHHGMLRGGELEKIKNSLHSFKSNCHFRINLPEYIAICEDKELDKIKVKFYNDTLLFFIRPGNVYTELKIPRYTEYEILRNEMLYYDAIENKIFISKPLLNQSVYLLASSYKGQIQGGLFFNFLEKNKKNESLRFVPYSGVKVNYTNSEGFEKSLNVTFESGLEIYYINRNGTNIFIKNEEKKIFEIPHNKFLYLDIYDGSFKVGNYSNSTNLKILASCHRGMINGGYLLQMYPILKEKYLKPDAIFRFMDYNSIVVKESIKTDSVHIKFSKRNELYYPTINTGYGYHQLNIDQGTEYTLQRNEVLHYDVINNKLFVDKPQFSGELICIASSHRGILGSGFLFKYKLNQKILGTFRLEPYYDLEIIESSKEAYLEKVRIKANSNINLYYVEDPSYPQYLVIPKGEIILEHNKCLYYNIYDNVLEIDGYNNLAHLKLLASSHRGKLVDGFFTTFKNSQVGKVGVLARNEDIAPIVEAIDLNTKGLNFVHFSDIHFDLARCSNLITYVNSLKNLDFVIHTGDISSNIFDEDLTPIHNILSETDISFLPVVGNHDVGASFNASFGGNHEQVFEKHIKDVVTGSNNIEGKSYYYSDFSEKKVRLIVLYEYDGPIDFSENTEYWKLIDFVPTAELWSSEKNYEEGDIVNLKVSKKYSFKSNKKSLNKSPTFKFQRDYRILSQEQIDWFILTLKDTPEEYSVIVALHQFPVNVPEELDIIEEFSSKTFYKYTHNYIKELIIPDIVNAWQKSTTLNKKYSLMSDASYLPDVEVNCDFTNRKEGKFITYLCGHHHGDVIAKLKNYNQILIAVTTAHLGRELGDLPRVNYAKSQDAFNLVSINLTQREITLVRVGSYISRETFKKRQIVRLKF